MKNFPQRNERRLCGCSYYYSFKAVRDFLVRNRLVSIIRAHEMHDDGSVESFYVSLEVPVDPNCV